MSGAQLYPEISDEEIVSAILSDGQVERGDVDWKAGLPHWRNTMAALDMRSPAQFEEAVDRLLRPSPVSAAKAEFLAEGEESEAGARVTRALERLTNTLQMPEGAVTAVDATAELQRLADGLFTRGLLDASTKSVDIALQRLDLLEKHGEAVERLADALGDADHRFEGTGPDVTVGRAIRLMEGLRDTLKSEHRRADELNEELRISEANHDAALSEITALKAQLAQHLDAATPERPFQVGDIVTWGTGAVNYKIAAISDREVVLGDLRDHFGFSTHNRAFLRDVRLVAAAEYSPTADAFFSVTDRRS